MAEFEGIKINAEAVKSTVSTSQSSMAKNEIKVLAGLLGANIDSCSINAQIARGKSAIKNLSNFSPEDSNNLNNNMDTFQSNINKISKPLQSCLSLSEQGNSLISDSTEAVKENGNLIGVSISTSQSKSDYDSADTIISDNTPSISSSMLEQKSQNEINSIFGDNTLENDSDKFSSNEEKQVFSCDWGNGAKTVEEINSANQKSKINKGLFGFIDNNGNSFELSNINTSNSKIKNQIESIKKQKSDEFAKSSDSSNKKEELVDRFMTDLQGVKTTNSQNLSGFSNEKNYSAQIYDNIKTGNKYLEDARAFNETEKVLIDDSVDNLSLGIDNNSLASEFVLSGDSLAAQMYAQAASIYNGAAGMFSEIIKKTEIRSLESQNAAIKLAKDSVNIILPGYKESVQNRIAENQKSLNSQKETKAIIKNQQNLDSPEYLSFNVDSLNNQEKALVSTLNKNKTRIDELNSNKDKFNEGNFENNKKDFII